MSHLWRFFNANLGKGTGQLELELRINQKAIGSDGRFQAILSQFKASDKYKVTDPEQLQPIITTVTFLGDRLRIIKNETTGNISAETKTNISMSDDPEGMYRISINREIPETLPSIPGKNPRHRERWSFDNKEHPFTVMLTMVTGNNGDTHGEIEIEYNQPNKPMMPTTLAKMIEVAKEIANPLHFVSDLPKVQVPSATSASSRDPAILFNSLLGYGEDKKYIKFPVTKPIDLSLKDLVWATMSQYMATFKANGERISLLLESKDKVWLIMRGKVTRADLDLDITTTASGPGNNNNNNKYPMILDGELVRELGIFYMFDCLVWDGKKLLGQIDLPRRIVIMSQIQVPLFRLRPFSSSGPPTTSITSQLKPYFSYGSVDEFALAMRQMRENSNNGLLPFEVDGIVFEPISSTILPQLKWKPSSQQTLDFQIIKQYPYIGYKDKSNRVVPLRDQTKGADTGTLKLGDIGEFLYSKDQDRFIVKRLRDDRTEPNFQTQVWKGLSLIKNPIEWETLCLEDLILMRKYHNREKNDIYQNLGSSGIKSLVDVGSGTGGDVLKWQQADIKQILAIEPNKNSFEVLEQRVKELKMDGRVATYNESILDIQLAPGENVDAITMFNSMTFFAQDDMAMSKLMNVLDPMLQVGGLLVIMYMDGDLAQIQMPRPTYEGDQITLKYKSPSTNEVNINIKASGIVTDQDEYLVSKDLIYNHTTNYELVRDYKLDQEPLQSIDGQKLSMSTKVAILKKTNPNRYSGEDEYMIIGDKDMTDFPAVVIIQDSRDLLAVILSSIYPQYIELKSPSQRRDMRADVWDTLKDRGMVTLDDPDEVTFAQAFSLNLVFISIGEKPLSPTGLRINQMKAESGKTLIIGQDGDGDFYLIGKLRDDGWVATNFHKTDTVYIGNNKAW